jgi:ferrous iron transport protein A
VKGLTLDELKPGERARVRGCRGDGPAFQRLCEMGFVEGAPLRVVRFAPFGDPVEVEIRDCHLSLRKAEAAMVQVERLVPPHRTRGGP